MKGITGFKVSNYGKKSKTPKTDKFIGKVAEFGANVATGGLYGQAKKYVKKQGGLAKTLDKHLPIGNKTKKIKKAAKTYGVLKSDKNVKSKHTSMGSGSSPKPKMGRMMKESKKLVKKQGLKDSMKKVARSIEKKRTITDET